MFGLHQFSTPSKLIPSEFEDHHKVYYDEKGRDVLIEWCGPDQMLRTYTYFQWGDRNAVKTINDDIRPIGALRRWLWKMVERFFVQYHFPRPLWKKILHTLFNPDFLVRSDHYNANRKLSEFSIYVYYSDGSLAGIERHLADGTFVEFQPNE